MTDPEVVIGTRGSALAMWQTYHVVDRLQSSAAGLHVRVVPITTQGDRVRDRALSRVGGQGLFVKEIEAALLAGEIDLAVHSLKDVPTVLPDGLALGAILERADARDALITRDGCSTLSTLPHGALVGTSSLRRRAQLLAVRSDLQVVDLRGNVDTRLLKLREGEYEAIVLAVAGLVRLGHANRISERLPVKVMLPAPGQGALCVEIRDSDVRIRSMIASLDHQETHQAARAERAFLHRLGGGCQVPVGAYAEVCGGQLHLRGLVALPSGARMVRREAHGRSAQAERLGLELAERMLSAGGEEILQEVQLGR